MSLQDIMRREQKRERDAEYHRSVRDSLMCALARSITDATELLDAVDAIMKERATRAKAAQAALEQATADAANKAEAKRKDKIAKNKRELAADPSHADGEGGE